MHFSSDFIDHLKAQLPEYLTQTNRSLKKNFLCPFHTNAKTPAMHYYRKGNLCKCFNPECNAHKGVSIFDLVGIDQGIDLNDFPSLVRATAKLLGEPVMLELSDGSIVQETEGGKIREQTPEEIQAAKKREAERKKKIEERAQAEAEKEKENQEKAAVVIKRAKGFDWEKINDDQKSFLKSRGIHDHIAKRFGGFINDPELFPYKPLGVFAWQSGNKYTARDIDPKCNQNYRVLNAPGVMQPFNLECIKEGGIVFVVEAALDAMAVESTGFHAVAINGGSGVRETIKALLGVADVFPIFAFDDDETGANYSAQFADAFNKAERTYLRADEFAKEGGIWGNGCKDPGDVAKNAVDNKAEPIEAVSMITRELYGKAENLKRGKAGLIVDAACMGKSNVFELLMADKKEAVSTGFAQLDLILGGYKRGGEVISHGGLRPGLVVLGAETGVGKTSFLLQIADAIAEKTDRDIALFALEMSKEEMLKRSFCRLGTEYGQDYDFWSLSDRARLENTRTTETEESSAFWEIYDRYMGKIAPRFFVYEPENYEPMSPSSMRYKIKLHQQTRGKAPIVIVDYLQILGADSEEFGRKLDERTKTNAIIYALKQLAMELDTTVIVVSAFNRASAGNTEPRLSAFKESGTIEYTADLALVLSRKPGGKTDENGFFVDDEKDDQPRNMILSVLKNRHGKSGKHIAFEFDSKHFKFTEGELLKDYPVVKTPKRTDKAELLMKQLATALKSA